MSTKYLGLAPYSEENQFDFVGRNNEIWALYDRISRNDYTVYYAASGEGKSSLIRAGLLPILRRRDYFPIYILLNDSEFNDETRINGLIEDRISIEIQKRKGTYEEIEYVQSEWSKSYYTEEQSIALENNSWWKLRNFCFRKKNGAELKPLFIFDQFEEVFTKADYGWTDSFFRWLEEISTDYLPNALTDAVESLDISVPTQKKFKILFSLRTEYLGDLDYWCVQKHSLPSLQDNRMCLKPLTIKGAREVVNLNKDLSGIHLDAIIHGCAVQEVNTENEEIPCVSALILSVVCQTLSEISEKEREILLEELNTSQNSAIDSILIRFYKKKLKEAGLDYNNDETMIAAIEDAFVNENGRRRRRETDEQELQPFMPWIERLCGKDNGLVRVIGIREVDGKIIKSVELAHDRLCKAIDMERKERQAKFAYKFDRSHQWMQFWCLIFVFGVTAYVIIKSKFLESARIFFFLDKENLKNVWNCLSDYICFNPVSISGLDGNFFYYFGCGIDEIFSTLFLMVLLIVFTPILTFQYFNRRQSRRFSIVSSCTSFLSVILFGLLCIRNNSIQFEHYHTKLITSAGLIISCLTFFVFCRQIHLNKVIVTENRERKSYWPYLGSFFLLVIFVFYISLRSVSIGLNEPIDSFWGVFVLPLLYTLLIKEYFQFEVDSKSSRLLCCGLTALLSLVVFFYCGYNYNQGKYHVIWQNHGISLSIIAIIFFSVTAFVPMLRSKSSNIYYNLTVTKRVIASLGGIFLTVITFVASLGYNPLKIDTRLVEHVNSWRTVRVKSDIDMEDQEHYVLLLANGDTILPSCKLVRYGEYIIETMGRENPFPEGGDSNPSGSLKWKKSQGNSILSGIFVSIPTSEEKIYTSLLKGAPSDTSYEVNFSYYSYKLCDEIRKANINWLLYDKEYGIESIPSLEKLDSIQSQNCKIVLNKFVDKSDDTGRGVEIIMTDEDLVELGGAITKIFLLQMIKDRCNLRDMPSMFDLSYLSNMILFSSVPMSRYCQTYNISMQSGNYSQSVITVTSDDILNRRAFAWYDLFRALCFMDMGYNVTRRNFKFDELIKSSTESTEKMLAELIGFQKLITNKEYEISSAEQINPYLTSIFDKLYPVLLKNSAGIYNNALEQICVNILCVSAFRGYNIQDKTDKMKEYFTNKHFLVYTLAHDEKIQEFEKAINTCIPETIPNEANNFIPTC